MQQRSRLKKYFLAFCIFFLIDEIVVHQTQTVAPAVVAVPIAYEVAMAGAAALGAIYSAYLVSQLSDDLLKAHSQCLPVVAQELRTVYPAPVAVQAKEYTSQEIQGELEKAIGTAAFRAAYPSKQPSSELEREIKHKIQDQIISPVIARTAYISCASANRFDGPNPNVSIPTSGIVVTHQPGLVRADFTHLNVYALMRVSRGEALSPLKQQLIQQDQARAVDAAVAAYMYEHCPAYRRDFFEQYNAIVKVLKKMNDEDPVRRIYARFIFPTLQIEEPFTYFLQDLIDSLIPQYFDQDGKLNFIEFDTRYDVQFCIRKFFKRTVTNYNSILNTVRDLKLDNVVAYEESTGIWWRDNLWHVATLKWFPDVKFWSWYPYDIRLKISVNAHNESIKRLLYYCDRHNFVEADNFIKQCNDPIYKKVYTECYNHYVEEYCDDYGIRYGYSKDPYWTRLSHKVKQEIAKDIHAITAQNAALATRSIQKKAMQNAWQISDDAPEHVHHALYDLIEDLGTGPQFVAKVHEILARYTGGEREQLIEALFMPNGFLKDFGHFAEKAFYDFQQTIFAPEHAHDLKRINELLYSAHAYSGTEQSQDAFNELGKILSEFKVSSADNKETCLGALETNSSNENGLQVNFIGECRAGLEPNTILTCEIPGKNNTPEISKCPKYEEDQPLFGCGQPEMPEPIITGGCLPDFPESDIVRCPGVVGGFDPEAAVTSCNWSRNPQVPGLLDINPEGSSPEGSSSEENQNNDENDQNDEPAADDEVIPEEAEITPQEKYPKNKKTPKKGAKPWDLPEHDPAIDIEKIDFSEVPYLIGEEIELIKHCIELFLEVEGFLANDGALWRILKHEDQKMGHYLN